MPFERLLMIDLRPESPNLDDPTARRPRRLIAAIITALAIVIPLVGPPVASAVLISTGDGNGNLTPPPSDPGFANVGRINGLSGVYVGNGWVLTAAHVGANPIDLGGVAYEVVPGSRVRFGNNQADLITFKLLGPDPPLPAIAITDSAPTLGTVVTMIGNGITRGAATSFGGNDGWFWGTNRLIRWGTNAIDELDADGVYGVGGTEAFSTRFDDGNPGGLHEATAINGDSGGGVFTGSGPSAKLIGILFARAVNPGQSPTGISLFGNHSIIVDLFEYRTDILALIDQPECNDGLDDDGDGLVDFPSDPGCSDALDTDERGASFACDNGLDDDGDTLTDYPDDPDCLGPTHESEAPPIMVPTGSLSGGLLSIALWLQARRSMRVGSSLVD